MHSLEYTPTVARNDLCYRTSRVKQLCPSNNSLRYAVASLVKVSVAAWQASAETSFHEILTEPIRGVRFENPFSGLD